MQLNLPSVLQSRQGVEIRALYSERFCTVSSFTAQETCRCRVVTPLLFHHCRIRLRGSGASSGSMAQCWLAEGLLLGLSLCLTAPLICGGLLPLVSFFALHLFVGVLHTELAHALCQLSQLLRLVHGAQRGMCWVGRSIGLKGKGLRTPEPTVTCASISGTDVAAIGVSCCGPAATVPVTTTTASAIVTNNVISFAAIISTAYSCGADFGDLGSFTVTTVIFGVGSVNIFTATVCSLRFARSQRTAPEGKIQLILLQDLEQVVTCHPGQQQFKAQQHGAVGVHIITESGCRNRLTQIVSSSSVALMNAVRCFLPCAPGDAQSRRTAR
ncbi:hypothetical protein EYF80_025790 [Liparis tanakae]|uniref:Uncharacterized protein n=1 Tax=Liparis tanakae TaxID=230148 RepID=A0A4Z2HDI7_9TELE|nr:hypothetical protein EYF80_025790 [Liparis tanakae]